MSYWETVLKCLQETGIEAHLLELELIKSASIDDPERIIPLMRRLRLLGVSVSIDDFGAGY